MPGIRTSGAWRRDLRIARRSPAALLLLLLNEVGCLHARVPRGTPDRVPVTQSRAANVATDAEFRSAGPVDRVEDLMRGRFAGVEVISDRGGTRIRVRGATTLYGSPNPLFVLDGVVIAPGAGGLAGVSPSDIARIEVLKDAADLAMYGIRGANGVVLVTTKRPSR